tara:strand:+ start:2252 stop:2518 length:267 start_codon:yes stop_codon:yes gene_type:complete
MDCSFIKEIDEFVFEVNYTYEKGMRGDGWLQPDDPDYLEYDQILLVSHTAEDGTETHFKSEIDCQEILSEAILESISDAMQEDIDNYS